MDAVKRTEAADEVRMVRAAHRSTAPGTRFVSLLRPQLTRTIRASASVCVITCCAFRYIRRSEYMLHQMTFIVQFLFYLLVSPS
jgi:hypothetical protein